MWVVIAAAGLVVELAVIVLLGRSAVRRDEYIPDYGHRPFVASQEAVGDGAVPARPGPHPAAYPAQEAGAA